MLARRLIRELYAITKFAGPITSGRYLGQIFVHARTIAREKVLTAADEAMCEKPFKVRLFGTQFELGGQHFALAREIYGRRPYFLSPEFRIRPGDTVVDMGANEGLFTILAARLGARVLAVEALPTHVRNLRALIKKESLWGQVIVVQSLLGPATGMLSKVSDSVSISNLPKIPVSDLLTKYGLRRVNFLKVDIEGSEFDLFAGDNQWLNTTDKIAMEVHPHYGNVSKLIERLNFAGFDCRILNSSLETVEHLPSHSSAGYLHAVRRPDKSELSR